MKKPSKLIPATLVFMLVLQLFAFITNSNAYASQGELRVQMYLGNTAQTTNTISPNFRIYNDGTNPLNMSEVKLRYYYTKDSSSTQNFVCDSCLYNNANISGVTGNFIDITPPTSNADNYLEISFPQGIILAPNSSIELRNRIYKSDWSNFNQSNDYSFNPTGTDYQDWNKVTAYLSNSIIWGSKSMVIPNPKKFLVIVSSKIYSYCQTELNTYMSDLANEGWAPTLIKVNNVTDSNYVGDTSFHVCENPNALKQVIRAYYDQGYEGFVLIGSAPSIPCAYWESSSTKNEKAPTDLFYSDMSNWSDSDGDGSYEQPVNPTQDISELAPDMIYGRISAGAISDSDQQASQKTSEYLSKIHNFRLAGRNMSFEPKAFSFADDDFTEDEPQMVTGLANLEKEIYSISNKVSTTKSKFLDLLQGGYRLGYETIHAFQESWSITSHPNGSEDDAVFDYPTINDINGITVKVNYLHLNSCSACDFTKNNLGAALLFNKNSNTGESNVYNITGMTTSSIFFADPQYFEDLKSNCIGTAFKSLVSRHQNGNIGSVYILLGDPTLKYKFTNPQNRSPHVSNDLSDVNAYPDKPFNINLQTTDPENDPVFLDVSGLPEGATYDNSTKTIDWVPQASQAGNSYNVTVTAYNKDLSGEPVNKYVQYFTIYVSRMNNLIPQEIPNPGFESLNTDGTPSGWGQAGSPSLDQIVKHSGNYSAKITRNSPGYYVLNTNVEPNTTYLISGYIKTSSVTGGAYLSILPQSPLTYVYSNSIVGTQDWTPVYFRWFSGDNTSVQIQCGLTDGDTAWFDDFKLEKDYNLGFEFYRNNATGINKWATLNLNIDPTTIQLDSSVKHNGHRSAKIAFDQLNYGYISNIIPVEAGATYRVGVWVKTSNISNGSASLAVRCGSDAFRLVPVTAAENEWKQVYLDCDSGSNTSITVKCSLGALNEQTTGTAWFDDVTIEKK